MNQYREKTCPTCNTVHRKRGPFCSRSCGNARVHTKEHIQHLSTKATEAHASGVHVETTERWSAGGVLARKKALNPDDADLQELSYEDLFLQPVVKTLPEGKFVQDGDLWTDADW
jgi:hypothetical protein